jgi:hypothetical protein
MKQSSKLDHKILGFGAVIDVGYIPQAWNIWLKRTLGSLATEAF